MNETWYQLLPNCSWDPTKLRRPHQGLWSRDLWSTLQIRQVQLSQASGVSNKGLGSFCFTSLKHTLLETVFLSISHRGDFVVVFKTFFFNVDHF